MTTHIRLTVDGIKVSYDEINGSYILGPLSRKGKNLTRQSYPDIQSWWQLYSFTVDKSSRRKGHGNLLMADVLRRSDAMECSIILQAQSYGEVSGLTTDQLVFFYQKHGFEIVDQPNNSFWLIRLFGG